MYTYSYMLIYLYSCRRNMEHWSCDDGFWGFLKVGAKKIEMFTNKNAPCASQTWQWKFPQSKEDKEVLMGKSCVYIYLDIYIHSIYVGISIAAFDYQRV